MNLELSKIELRILLTGLDTLTKAGLNMNEAIQTVSLFNKLKGALQNETKINVKKSPPDAIGGSGPADSTRRISNSHDA